MIRLISSNINFSNTYHILYTFNEDIFGILTFGVSIISAVEVTCSSPACFRNTEYRATH